MTPTPAAGMTVTNRAIAQDDDGFYHPSSEAEIIELIRLARENGLQIRCRGAAHSVARSIYTDPGSGDPPIPNQVTYEEPPEGPNLNLLLDRLDQLDWIDVDRGIVEVEAGMHLGPDPHDPTGTVTLEKSLLFQAFTSKWGLNDLGGITHQTISGFTCTGSAGGSLTYDLADNILAFRIIDGRGDARWVEKDDPIFNAVALSLGLLGIVTRVRLQLNPTFDIEGQQITVPVEGPDCPIDLFGSGDETRKSFRQFLEDTPYTRLLWWPQKNAKRVVIWQAKRSGATHEWPANGLKPYREFANNVGGQLEQMGGAIFFTLLGNRGFLRTWRKLGPGFDQFRRNLQSMWRKSLGTPIAAIVATLLTVVVVLVSLPLVLFFSLFKGLLERLYPTILGLFQPMTKKGEAERFHDYYWRSLPMDNSAGDVLLGTGFTELFIPLQHTERAMNVLNDWYEEKGSSATGYYSTELYAGYKSARWLSPAYESGEYADGTVRFDFFWYENNEGMPNGKDEFFAQFWELFRNRGIPFRLHWGKYIPNYRHAEWAEYYRQQLPKWDDFLRLREERDPHNVFLTDYWKLHLMGATSPSGNAQGDAGSR